VESDNNQVTITLVENKHDNHETSSGHDNDETIDVEDHSSASPEKSDLQRYKKQVISRVNSEVDKFCNDGVEKSGNDDDVHKDQEASEPALDDQNDQEMEEDVTTSKQATYISL
jgi:hypothetical protein